MTPESLAQTLQAFLADWPEAVVLEEGKPIFDFSTARYSVAGDRGRCLLHLWSEERNVVRRVLDSEEKAGALCLTVQRFGQARPARLEIFRGRDRRTPSVKRSARATYLRRLEHTLQCRFPEYRLDRLTSSADLEHSFGPVYARGLLRRGRCCCAVLGVNSSETQASVDGALTFGILWLDVCRLREAQRAVVEGLKLFVPVGTSAVVRERAAHLDHQAAQFQVYEWDERNQEVAEIETSDRGNIATRLVSCPDPASVMERFSGAVARVRSLVPNVELSFPSSTEIVFRLYGLPFAHVRLAPAPDSLRPQEGIVFGAGAAESPLTEGSEGLFTDLLRQLSEARRPRGPSTHVLYRMYPERWLESLILRDVRVIDPALDPGSTYSQVPAFSASDRAMIDLLSVSSNGCLVVIELKAEEDIHLPLQGIDYWARVKWHHQRGEFQHFGYFPGCQLAAEPPKLYLVAPALHLHPATDTLLRYISPDIDLELVGIDERWRDGVRVIFRKHRPSATALARA